LEQGLHQYVHAAPAVARGGQLLQKILKVLAQESSLISLTSLSQRLDINQAALDGMLSTLVGMGKVRRVGGAVSCDDDSPICRGCLGSGGCPFALKEPAAYVLVTLPEVQRETKTA
jgi:hypothetical protein